MSIKGEKGILGKPKYKYGDTVCFETKFPGSEEVFLLKGTVDIVDAYGTFGQKEEPSYDVRAPFPNEEGVLVEGRSALYKHIRESRLTTPKGEE